MRLISAHSDYVAHHWLLLAGPAFFPAVVVVAVVMYVAIKDRRTAEQDQPPSHRDTADEPRD
jgi:hypothetical protein